MKSLGSLSLASAVVMLPIILAGCSEDSSSSVVPLPPPPPPAPPPAPPAPPPPPPAPTGSVIFFSPTDGSTNVATTTSIVIRFSEPVNEGPFNTALSITSIAPQQGVVPSRTVTFNDDRTQATITFATPLTNDAVYRVTISSTVPNLFASGLGLAENFVATFTTGNVAVPGGPISFLATQLAAVTPNGQIFSSPRAIPVGYGIRRASPAENVPVGVYTDYRAILSFPIPSSIPSNAVVQTAQLTLVQLPSNDSAFIPGFGDIGLGFFFLDPTPSNVPANNVVFQEVTLGAPNNIVSTDFFAPASTPSFIALSINGNVLGGDVSAGPRTADVAPGVQRSVSGSRFYQVRLQCAREVFNNQAFPVWAATATGGATATGTASATATGIVTQTAIVVETQTQAVTLTGSGTISGTVPAVVSITETGSVSFTFSGTFSGTVAVDGFTAVATGSAAGTATVLVTETGTFTLGPVVTVTASAEADVTVSVTATAPGTQTATSIGVVTETAIITVTAPIGVTTTTVTAGFEVSQGSDGVCRAEFDRGAPEPLTTSSAPRLDVTFTIPR
ncbi:MAG: Ig-like domain-containing protein [Thermostichus sp. DRC_bins_24]